MRVLRTPIGTVARSLLVLAVVAAAACGGSDADEILVQADAHADVSISETVTPTIECDPDAEPTGCADGALCWFGRCVPVVRDEVHDAAAPWVVGSVAALAEDAGGGFVAFHARRGPSVGGVREDLLFVSAAAGGALEAPVPIARWELEEDTDDPGPQLALVRGPAGEIALVVGPNPVRAYLRRGGEWLPSETLETGARIYTAEGALAAAYDGAGRLHVAYHDIGRRTLDVAVLGDDGTFSVRTVLELGDEWGSRIAAVTVDGRVAIAHVFWGEPNEVRGVTVAYEPTDGPAAAAWEIETPSLAEGLTVRGQVLGFAGAVDAEGRLSLAWLAHSQRLGVSVRRDDGLWSTDQDYLSAIEVSDEVHHNLSLSWWGEAPVLAWIGAPERECRCFDVRMAMRKDGRWLEYRLERYPSFEAADAALSVAADGSLLLPVGGGPLVTHGTPTLLLLSGTLPNW